MRITLILLATLLTSTAAAGGEETQTAQTNTRTGSQALGDWTTDAPGVRRKITLDDLALPFETPSAKNHPNIVARPDGAWPQAPKGFEVTEFAAGLIEPRIIVCAPNGDLFVAESRANRVRILRDTTGDGRPDVNEIFAGDLTRPFGIAFYPPGNAPTHLYVANTDSVVRFDYRSGDTKASSQPQAVISDIPSGNESAGGGGHWTRDLEFSPDGQTLYVAIGSRSNVDDDRREDRRACILAFDPDGRNERVYATGIRNPVGLATHPKTGELWTSVNERDGLGDNLVPDYITPVQEGGFYGWPWYYMGPHQDPRHAGKRPDLKDKVLTPDVLLQSHMASLGMTFYAHGAFPQEYHHDAFAAQHGSWNRTRRVGYKVIRIPMNNGKATGEFEDFLVGFVTENGDVWGRPVGVAIAADGALMVTDDGSGVIWRVAYKGR